MLVMVSLLRTLLYNRQKDKQTNNNKKTTDTSPLTNAEVLVLLCMNSQLLKNTVGCHVIDARTKLNITGKMSIV